MRYDYHELGLVNTAQMFENAYRYGYAVPALNFVSIEQLNAIVDAVIEKKSPVILLVSPNLHRQIGHEMTARLAQVATDRIRSAGLSIPAALHLDHGMTFEQVEMAVEGGVSSVMMEAELGILKGKEEQGTEGTCESMYTDPEMAVDFIERSGCDSLAISIGTCHGLVKMKPNPDGTLPELRFDILSRIQERKPGFPIVLHGCSNIPKEYVDMINRHGGHIERTVGIPDEQVRKAAKMAVCKVNIATDGWICALANTRRILDENPDAIDSRVFSLKIRPILKELYEHKIDIMGSAGRA